MSRKVLPLQLSNCLPTSLPNTSETSSVFFSVIVPTTLVAVLFMPLLYIDRQICQPLYTLIPEFCRKFFSIVVSRYYQRTYVGRGCFICRKSLISKDLGVSDHFKVEFVFFIVLFCWGWHYNSKNCLFVAYEKGGGGCWATG